MSEHRVTGAQQVVRIVLGLFCLLVAFDCVYLGMWPRFGPIHWGAFTITGVIALVFFWLTFDAFAQYFKARRQKVVCHDFGLRIYHLQTRKDVRFDDVTLVGGMLWQPLPGMVPSGAVMWLDDVQGRRIELPAPLSDANDLGQTIRSSTFDKRRASTESSLSRGESVRFGRVQLGSLVIVIDGELVPRSIIESVRLSNRWLAIKVSGQRERLIPSEEIPNLDVLLSLFA